MAKEKKTKKSKKNVEVALEEIEFSKASAKLKESDAAASGKKRTKDIADNNAKKDGKAKKDKKDKKLAKSKKVAKGKKPAVIADVFEITREKPTPKPAVKAVAPKAVWMSEGDRNLSEETKSAQDSVKKTQEHSGAGDEARRAELDAKIASIELQRDAAIEEIKSEKAKSEDLLSKLEQAQAKLQEIEAKALEATDAKATLEHELQASNKHLGDALADLRSAHEKITALENTVANTNAEDPSKEIEERDQRIAALEVAIEQGKAALAEKQEQLDTANAQQVEYEGKIIRMQAQLDEALAALKEAKARLDSAVD